MGLYSDAILPRLIDLVMRAGPFRELRRTHLAPLSGKVLEIGFGSGLNLEHYPAAVDEVLAIEPCALARKLAAPRVRRASIEVRLLDLGCEALPLPDESIDTALSTWTLCTIPQLDKALGELRRVLRPGARFHFLEHGLAPDPAVARWQRRLNRCQMSLCGGCRLDRDIAAELRAQGFHLDRLETFYMPGPRTHAHIYAGVAHPS